MHSLVADPGFRALAGCAALLALQMVSFGLLTAVARRRERAFVDEEDAERLGASAQVTDPPEAARRLRILASDSAHVPIFLLLGLMAVLAGTGHVAVYALTFTGARMAHGVFWLNSIQPWRALAGLLGAACTAGLAVQLLLRFA